MNIIYVHSHDTGRYIQPYGIAVATPNLQRLAEEGVVFRRAFSCSATCGPSRAALLTGQTPHSAGMLGQPHLGWALNHPEHHIVHTLRTGGYASTLCGQQHVARNAQAIGYDTVLPVANTEVQHVAPAAADWLLNTPAEPFFLAVGFKESHRYGGSFRPREDTPPADARHVRPPPAVPDTPTMRQEYADFLALVRTVDTGVGMLLDALDQAGLAERTLVVYTTDHGIAFPGMKATMTDHGIGVAMVARGPNGFTGGRVIDQMVSHLDLYPTWCELAGVPCPAWAQGQSLLPLLRDPSQPLHNTIFAEMTYHGSYDPQRCIRTDRHKLIRRFDGRNRPAIRNIDAGDARTEMLHYGWRDRRLDEVQLYDLVFDPHEQCNVAGDPEYQDVRQDLERRLTAWMQQTDDPLLRGPVPSPEGITPDPPDFAYEPR